jgi:hypothetical protein
MIRVKCYSPFMASLVPAPWFRLSFPGKHCVRNKIGHWLLVLKNDAFRLQHFERDDLTLVLGAVRGVQGERQTTQAAARRCFPRLP